MLLRLPFALSHFGLLNSFDHIELELLCKEWGRAATFIETRDILLDVDEWYVAAL
jgi:hypothetical protein